MILFKSCSRCGGDVDATFEDEVYCIQCGHRPVIAAPDSIEDRRRYDETILMRQESKFRPAKATNIEEKLEFVEIDCLCPRCDSDIISRLEKLRTQDNTCFRCRRCGHIFSPRLEETEEFAGVAVP